MKSRGSLIAIVLIALGALAATLIADNKPQLGLDLQGGASVVLRPNRKVESGAINQTIEIIRNRVDALGVAEPDISRQGSAVVVQLPGVKDQKRALSIVGQTAELRFRPVLQVLPAKDTSTSSTTSTTTPGQSTTTTAPADPAAAAASTTTSTSAIEGTTRREDNKADAAVVLPELDRKGDVVRRYQLGPAELTGRVVKTARARAPQGFTGDWSVTVDFTGAGSKQFDQLAQKNFQRQVAIELDGVVKSAPTINAQQFNGTAEITGNFTQREAKDLALVLRFGALPVQLEPQEVRTISATLGRDSLDAGIAAGVVGLILVLLYIVFYYRALGLVVMLGLVVWGALQWSIIAFLGESYGLALSLAGAVGIIVSVGVTVDSYVVYFERLKDEIRSGRSIRSSVERGFTSAFRTIRTADISSLIAAGLLYWLTVGPVRGFAFFLGLATLLDLVTAYFFTRPLVGLLSRNDVFTQARHLGIARGLAVEPVGEPA